MPAAWKSALARNGVFDTARIISSARAGVAGTKNSPESKRAAPGASVVKIIFSFNTGFRMRIDQAPPGPRGLRTVAAPTLSRR